MRLARLGEIGSERPAVLIDNKNAVLVDHLISDWDRKNLEGGGLERVRQADLGALPTFPIPKSSTDGEASAGSRLRISSPIARPTKLICIGLNYAKHADESGLTPPPEPVVFMKAPDCLIGPNDPIHIPPYSTSTDYEVELAVIIGKRALYLDSPDQANDYILGYSISQDVSERDWQLNRSGQWMKGKSFPSFNPIGPVVVTKDEIDPGNLRIHCSVDGEVRQDSRTNDLIFGVNHIVWYLSQFMELHPGDVINTGTPQGVGMGFKPTKYLKGGELVSSSIEGIGEIRSRVVRV
ncbi:MAG: fumarylacetoacetate hydrolase family protein [Actinobacteria bacterium]|nr:fumarylacetoacetate hydrolase family protein [Actinomycetota bacterium]